MKILRVAGVLFLCLVLMGCRQTNDAAFLRISSPSNVVVNAVDPAPPEGMIFIPGGTFQMGDTFGEGSSSELPVHSVYVSGFHMDKYEVTKALWDEVHSWAVTNGYSFDHAGSGKAANHPVHTVNWFDCVKWCNARSEKEGRTPCYNLTDWSCDFSGNGYRLPTEAEWEKAARGGLNGKRYGWGDTINHSNANYRANGSTYSYDTSPYASYVFHPSYDDGDWPYSSPVGSFSPNGYGLYDMAGNMWEWCGDWYDEAYYATSPSSNPHGASTGTRRVGCGGCWFSDAWHCRSADSLDDLPSYSSDFVGFRSALSAKP